MKTVSLQKRLPRKSSSKKHRMRKESVSKQGRKIAKGESSVQRDPLEDKRKGDEGQEIDEVRLSTEDAVSTDKEGVSTDFEKVSTDFEKVSTDKPKVSTDGSKVSTDEQVEGTEEHNEGSEEIFESTEEQVEGIDRPSKTVYNITSHLKASSKIDPQDKGKKKFKEDDESESEDVILPQANSAEKAFKEQEREHFDNRRKRKVSIIIQFAAQRKVPCSNKEQRHSKQTYKKFEDIQAMYEKIKRSDEDFIAIGSVEDESLIKKMKKKDSSKGEEIKQESKEEVKEEDKDEENTRKRKHAPDEDKEVDYEILDKKYPIIDWKTENLGTKPQIDESKRSEEINMNVVTRSNGQKRSFSTLMRVLSVFDREDLDAVYKLVMNIYQDKIPEGPNTQTNKELSIPEQMATGIGTSNPLMAGKMDLNAFIRTADPHKVRIVERPRTEKERPIVTMAKHHTVTLLPTSVSRPSGELSKSIEREFGEDGSGGGGQEDAFVAGHGNVRPVVPIHNDIIAKTRDSPA
ncbi:hypothetical protein Tco_1142962 [Tanacetum coccineum]